MTEQCMHDGKSGPCERPAAPAEHFCRRHLPKKASKKTPVGFDTEPRKAERPVKCHATCDRGLT